MTREKMGDSRESEKDAITNKLQNNLVHYLSIFGGYEDRPEEILEEAKKTGVTLDIDAAMKKGMIKALDKEEVPENLDLIMEFAEKHQVAIDLTQPDLQRAIEHSYATLLSTSKSAELSDLKKFIDKHDISVDEDLIFQQALVMTLNRGDGQRANNLANKIKKDERKFNFSDPVITQAVRQGLTKTLHEGRADLVNRLINFTKRKDLEVEINEPWFINAAKEGLKKSIRDMRLGPGGVTLAERMVKLIRKLKLPIGLNSSEITQACKEALEATKKSHEEYPAELKMFNAYPHIEAFLKRCGIDIE